MIKTYKRKRRKRMIILTLIPLILILLTYKLDRDLKPVLMALCDAQARIIATQTINSTIREEFGNKISYDDIMTVKTDKNGKVVMIQANTVELNRIGSQIALSVQNRIQQTGNQVTMIPIGVLLKNDLFAQLGPKIKFRMQPVGSVVSSYRSEFESAGINQTRQVVYLDVTANVLVLIPLAKNSISLTSSIPIAESIIVGDVPNTYANLDGLSGINGSSNSNTGLKSNTVPIK